MNEISVYAPIVTGGVSTVDIANDEDLRDFVLAEKAESSRRSYASDFRLFSIWCHATGAEPMPALPLTVARWLTVLAKGRRRSPDDAPRSNIATRSRGIHRRPIISW
jgi:hypothetical protein